jgi:hypothetical protein
VTPLVASGLRPVAPDHQNIHLVLELPRCQVPVHVEGNLDGGVPELLARIAHVVPPVQGESKHRNVLNETY